MGDNMPDDMSQGRLSTLDALDSLIYDAYNYQPEEVVEEAAAILSALRAKLERVTQAGERLSKSAEPFARLVQILGKFSSAPEHGDVSVWENQSGKYALNADELRAIESALSAWRRAVK